MRAVSHEEGQLRRHHVTALLMEDIRDHENDKRIESDVFFHIILYRDEMR